MRTITILAATLLTACFPGPLSPPDSDTTATDTAVSDTTTDAIATTDTSDATGADSTPDADVTTPECTDDDDCDALTSTCHDGHCHDGHCESRPLTGTPCDDGAKCTTNDTCEAGTCRGSEKLCEPSANPCLSSHCVAETGACEQVAVPDDDPCSDESACTSADHCESGVCVGEAVACGDVGGCVADVTCEPAQGCVYAAQPIDTVCEVGATSGFCRGTSCGSKAMAFGRTHMCLVLPDEGLECWGNGSEGLLGYGYQTIIGDDEAPSAVGDSLGGARVLGVGAGAGYTCVLRQDRAVLCFGGNALGQLGLGSDVVSVGAEGLPTRTVALNGTVRELRGSDSHVCALLTDGRVQCWGSGRFGKLGYGAEYDVFDPQHAGEVDVGHSVRTIQLGPNTSCAIGDFGSLKCWGYNEGGELGYGMTGNVGDDEAPSELPDIDAGMVVREVAIGTNTICAREDDGAVKCWGSGILGYADYLGTVGDDETPADIGFLSLPSKAVQLAANFDASYALLDNGDVMVWGTSAHGVLGLGATAYAATPTLIPLSTKIVAIFAGAWNVCAIAEAGDVLCWGSNEGAQLGDPNQQVNDHRGDADGEMPPLPVAVDP